MNKGVHGFRVVNAPVDRDRVLPISRTFSNLPCVARYGIIT